MRGPGAGSEATQVLGQTRRVHFIGIGGIGMSGIAHVLLDRGYSVSGSDAVESETVRGLRAHGAEVHIGHRAENVGEVSVVVVSSAVRPSNPDRKSTRLNSSH